MSIDRQVWRRAGGICEYCHMPQKYDDPPFEIDHIIARKHSGLTILSNLALSCFYDNSYKGSNISGIDPKTGSLVKLFNPRQHKWSHHFRWDGPILIGRTGIGRVTIVVLQINQRERIGLRSLLMQEGIDFS
jgi:HNH endonuclease